MRIVGALTTVVSFQCVHARSWTNFTCQKVKKGQDRCLHSCKIICFAKLGVQLTLSQKKLLQRNRSHSLKKDCAGDVAVAMHVVIKAFSNQQFLTVM